MRAPTQRDDVSPLTWVTGEGMSASPSSRAAVPHGSHLDRKRQVEARALIKSLTFDPVTEPLKIAIMIRACTVSMYVPRLR